MTVGAAVGSADGAAIGSALGSGDGSEVGTRDGAGVVGTDDGVHDKPEHSQSASSGHDGRH